MANHYFTVEELMLDESFVSYCLKQNKTDVTKWKTIIHSNGHSEQIFSEAEQLVRLLHSGLSSEEVDAELQYIQNEIRLRQTPAENKEKEVYAETMSLSDRRLTTRLWLYTGIAASILVCVVLFFKNDTEQASQPAYSSLVTASSQSGLRKKVMLPDGSEIFLNSNSSINWDGTFNQKNRHVTLTGSAFFKVSKNPQKPFVVHSGIVSTTALGTSFYVQQLPSADNIEVSLLEGKISVEQNESNHKNIVYPGEEMVYHLNSHAFQKQRFDTSALHNWLSGELSFTNTKLKDILEEISFWYNVNIDLQNALLADKLVTGSYKDAPLDDVLKVMSFSFGFTYTTNSNSIIIH